MNCSSFAVGISGCTPAAGWYCRISRISSSSSRSATFTPLTTGGTDHSKYAVPRFAPSSTARRPSSTSWFSHTDSSVPIVEMSHACAFVVRNVGR